MAKWKKIEQIDFKEKIEFLKKLYSDSANEIEISIENTSKNEFKVPTSDDNGKNTQKLG